MTGTSPYLALLRRDALSAWSYRLSFLLQTLSAFFGVCLWFFFARFAKPSPEALGGGDYFSYLIVGMVLLGYMNVMLYTFAAKVRQEKVAGTLEMLLASPAPAYGLLWASALWEILAQTLSAAVLVGMAALLGGEFRCGSPFALAAVAGLFALSTASLGISAASLLLVFQKGEPVTPFVGALFALLGNVFFPPDVLPEPLRFISQFLPLTHANEAVRTLVLGAGGAADVAPQMLALGAFCAVLLPASYLVFKVCLNAARRYGLLAQY